MILPTREAMDMMSKDEAEFFAFKSRGKASGYEDKGVQWTGSMGGLSGMDIRKPLLDTSACTI